MSRTGTRHCGARPGWRRDGAPEWRIALQDLSVAGQGEAEAPQGQEPLWVGLSQSCALRFTRWSATLRSWSAIPPFRCAVSTPSGSCAAMPSTCPASSTGSWTSPRSRPVASISTATRCGCASSWSSSSTMFRLQAGAKGIEVPVQCVREAAAFGLYGREPAAPDPHQSPVQRHQVHRCRPRHHAGRLPQPGRPLRGRGHRHRHPSARSQSHLPTVRARQHGPVSNKTGTGLGLTITKMLAETMGGEITVRKRNRQRQQVPGQAHACRGRTAAQCAAARASRAGL